MNMDPLTSPGPRSERRLSTIDLAVTDDDRCICIRMGLCTVENPTDMETSKLQDHPSLSRNPLADKIIRSKTQISPPNHPITSHQFQSLGTCQESETQLAHYMSFSSGCPPRALTFVRTPECHDTPEISAITI